MTSRAATWMLARCASNFACFRPGVLPKCHWDSFAFFTSHFEYLVQCREPRTWRARQACAAAASTQLTRVAGNILGHRRMCLQLQLDPTLIWTAQTHVMTQQLPGLAPTLDSMGLHIGSRGRWQRHTMQAVRMSGASHEQLLTRTLRTRGHRASWRLPGEAQSTRRASGALWTACQAFCKARTLRTVQPLRTCSMHHPWGNMLPAPLRAMHLHRTSLRLAASTGVQARRRSRRLAGAIRPWKRMLPWATALRLQTWGGLTPARPAGLVSRMPSLSTPTMATWAGPAGM